MDVVTDMKPDKPVDLLTPSEVAKWFAVDPKTVARWAKSGRLRHVRTPGGHRRYLKEDVMDAFGDVFAEADDN